ncbi:MAG TPA: ABC transporter substrate-binding protein [Mycobacteriales bacterium]|nr:ABC transporter substrate-binding protein [Mycobacteriales bacterium]
MAGLPVVEGGQVVTDRALFPTVFHESPEFAALTAAGRLPPVAARVGRDPLVVRPVHEVGRYGGGLRRGFIGTSDRQNGARFCAGPDSLLYWDFQWQHVVPNIAADFELSDGGRVLTLHLRRGLRWSDGVPFTADDIIFWREDVSLDAELGGGGTSLLAGGRQVRVEKVDTFTVRYLSAVPNSLLPRLLAGNTDIAGLAANGHFGGGGFAPKHYLSGFHPKYTSKARADRLARDAGFDGWASYFANRATWSKNPQLPSVTPWIVTRPINNPPWELTANPYSIWVDTAGNQLPYIHTITMSSADSLEIINLRAAAGEYDFQDRHLSVAGLPVLVQNQKRGSYTVHRAPTKELDFGVRLNLAYAKDTYLGDLIRTADFRRALSLGVDRSQINQAFFLGTSEPTATVPADDSPYFPGPDWRLKWAAHDPAQANALLDRIGLTARDSSGYRARADGRGRIRLDYQAVTAFADFPAIGEMIKKQWEQIGIDLNVATVTGELIVQRAIANELMLSGHQVGTDDPFLAADTFLPTIVANYTGMIGIPYAKWFASGGRDGTEPPPAVGLLKDAMRLYERGRQAATDADRAALGQQLYRLHADQVWTIGVVGRGLSINGVYTARNTLRNIPGRMLNTNHQKTPSNALPMTFYYQ